MSLYLFCADSSFTFFIVFITLLLSAVMATVCFIIPHSKREKFIRTKNELKVGMTEEEMIKKFGEPTKITIVDDETKFISYIHSERGYAWEVDTKEIHVVIKDGIIIKIST